jgi:hypothetical protein
MNAGAKNRFPAFVMLALGALILAACAAGPQSAPQQSGSTHAEGQPLIGYDATSANRACELPAEQCPDAKRNADFLDACRLAGFRVLRCGCDDLCSGNVAKAATFYDAAGASKGCAKTGASCMPAESSAAFQDACTDAGHKLVQCGCEWLCNGPLKRP